MGKGTDGIAADGCGVSTAATASALSRKCSVCVRQRFCLQGKAKSRMVSPWIMVAVRSMQFSSSRTLPGQ